MDFGSIAAISVAILGLLAIPFMANSVTSYAISNYDQGVSVIMNSTPSNFSATSARKYPGSVEERLSPDRFEFSTKTAFGTFSVRQESNGMLMELDRGSEKLVLETSNNGTVSEHWTLSTPEYMLEAEKRFDRTYEKYSIPDGYCTKLMENGSISEHCYGNVGNIDDDWQEARKHMRDMSDKMKQAAESIELLNPDSVQWKYS